VRSWARLVFLPVVPSVTGAAPASRDRFWPGETRAAHRASDSAVRRPHHDGRPPPGFTGRNGILPGNSTPLRRNDGGREQGSWPVRFQTLGCGYVPVRHTSVWGDPSRTTGFPALRPYKPYRTGFSAVFPTCKPPIDTISIR